MRSLRGTILAIIAAAWGHAALSAVTFTADNTEVVIERKALPVVKFAAQEATNFLSRIFGAPIPVVNTPTIGKSSIILGVNEWSKNAGIDPESKPVDTYFIKTARDRVYLAGRDGRYDPLKVLTIWTEPLSCS